MKVSKRKLKRAKTRERKKTQRNMKREKLEDRPKGKRLRSDSNVFVQVGTQLIRGISGGERKRTNIGMELIIDPPVLFLDEPTTGLDASTANSVLLLLKR